MAKKELGYVELEWECPVCETRNPGSRRTCAGCGSPQPDDVGFETPIQATLIEDEETVKRAEAGPDIHCAFCDARNPAGATQCVQCGADLTAGEARPAGEVLGAHSEAHAPEVECPSCGELNVATAHTCTSCGATLAKPEPVPQAAVPSTKPRSRTRGGFSKIIFGAIAVVVLGVIILTILSSRTTELVGTVTDTTWSRRIAIQGLVPVERSTWRDEVPAGAPILSCQQKLRRTQDDPAPDSVEVCGTPYTVDTGTGFGKVEQDCRYQVYEDSCTYTVDEWQNVDTITLEGTDLVPLWPALSLQNDQREGERSQIYSCSFSANDKKLIYKPRSPEQYAKYCIPGSRWVLKVNAFNSIVSLESE